jgi:glucose 1-dehydrogenase
MAATPFQDRVVIVTGSTGQIGRACMEAFASEGARVAGIDIAEPADGHDEFLTVKADLRVEEEIREAIATVEGSLGPVEVLVQSAAIVSQRPFLDIDARDIDDVFAVNVRAILLGAQCAAKSMIANETPDAAIVNLTSTSARVSIGESAIYEASKGAVNMATRSLAVTLAPHGIRVNAVGPGSMAKPQGSAPRDPTALTDYEQRRIPLGRLGLGSDIASAVLFLASPAAGYITGAILYADGGDLATW